MNPSAERSLGIFTSQFLRRLDSPHVPIRGGGRLLWKTW